MAVWCGIAIPFQEGVKNEAVNFLAELYKQEYQYRSLSACRLAVSSVHKKVDGYEVSQHSLVT